MAPWSRCCRRPRAVCSTSGQAPASSPWPWPGLATASPRWTCPGRCWPGSPLSVGAAVRGDPDPGQGRSGAAGRFRRGDVPAPAVDACRSAKRAAGVAGGRARRSAGAGGQRVGRRPVCGRPDPRPRPAAGPASCCGTTGPSRRVRRSDHQRAPVRRRVAAGAAGRTRAAGRMADAAAAAAHRGGMGCWPPAALAGTALRHPAGVHAVGRLSRPSGCRIVNAHSARIPCGLTAVGHSLPGRLSWPEGAAERLWRWAVARHASGATARARRSEHGEVRCPRFSGQGIQ